MKKLVWAGTAALGAAVLLVTGVAASFARSADPTPSNIPYTLPVQIPADASAPSVSAQAPYTPAVLNLIAQLEPSSPPTESQIANATILMHGGTNTTCNNVGPTAAPTGYESVDHADVLDRRAGCEHVLRAERRDDHRADDVDEPRVVVRLESGERVGADGGNRGAGVDGDGSVRSSDRYRSPSELGA